MKVFFYTTFALNAFALNSILCRLALSGEEADAAGFTAVRLVSGAIALVVINYAISCRGLRVSKGDTLNAEDSSRGIDQLGGSLSPLLMRGLAQHVGALSGSWLSAVLLFAYAVCFSFAYLGLTAGTGALILFGSVQVTMIAVAILRGERPSALEWLGLAIAVGGLVYLVFPGLASPPLVSSLLMAAAGAAWGFYTLRGKSSNDPLADTTGNFVRSMPMAAAVALIFLPQIQLSTRGVVLAVISGAVTSGVGYTIWYAALKYHTAVRAAVLQLPVPLLTAFGGLILLGEIATARLWIASVLILGGIALTIFRRVAKARA
ncbi:MAG: DMT family transporter [Pyrinomonadaceae bacterium]